ncbi:MAG TPA: hypothetical protein VF587_11145 [Solirubrobacteraceae bacterium]|jgi:hypothetical protein
MHIRTALLLVVALLALVAAGCDDGKTPPTDQEFSTASRTIEEQKLRAVGRAQDLQRAQGNGRVSEQEVALARIQYLDAMAAFNGWLSGVETAINTSRDLRNDKAFAASLDGAVAYAQQYTTHVDQLLTRGEIGASSYDVTPIIKLTPVLLKAGQTIADWVTRRSDETKAQYRERALAEVQRLRWPQDPTAGG